MGRLLSIDRLAPELKQSRRARWAAVAGAVLIFGLAAGGMALGFYLNDSRAGLSQVLYHSTEPFGTAAGARMVYFPETETLIVRGWLMAPLKGSGVYQVWAVEGGSYRSLGWADSFDWVGFTLVSQRGLLGVTRIIITIEPPGGSITSPAGRTIAELVPGI